MVVRDINRRNVPKAMTIVATFVGLLAAGLWYSQQQGYELIIEVSYVLALFIVFAIVYDRFVMR